jgi:hypothetical protein
MSICPENWNFSKTPHFQRSLLLGHLWDEGMIILTGKLLKSFTAFV